MNGHNTCKYNRRTKSRLSPRDSKVFNSHVALLKETGAKLLKFHKRNRKSWWRMADGSLAFVQTIAGQLVTNYLDGVKPGTIIKLRGAA
jgi:hypothetical protein